MFWRELPLTMALNAVRYVEISILSQYLDPSRVVNAAAGYVLSTRRHWTVASCDTDDTYRW